MRRRPPHSLNLPLSRLEAFTAAAERCGEHMADLFTAATLERARTDAEHNARLTVISEAMRAVMSDLADMSIAVHNTAAPFDKWKKLG